MTAKGHRHHEVKDIKSKLVKKEETVVRNEGQAPQIPASIFSSGGHGVADYVKDRIADLCFAALIILLIVLYANARAGLDPFGSGTPLDEESVVKKAFATALAVVLGSLGRRSQAAAELVQRTIEVAITLKDMARGHQ